MNQGFGCKTEEPKTTRQRVVKYAIRHSYGGTWGYLSRDSHYSPRDLTESNMYSTVDEAVTAIVQFVRQYPHLAEIEKFSIVGVEIITTAASIREIPLKTL